MLSSGVKEEQIIALALDDDENIRYRNPLELGEYLRGLTKDKSKTIMYFLTKFKRLYLFKIFISRALKIR